MKNIPYKLFFIVCIQGLLGLQQAYATTYYVSPSGIDTNTGTSTSTPVKTITKALAKAGTSGDIIYVMTGTYVETVYIGQSGITLSAYPGNSPVIDGTTTLPSADWGSLLYVGGNYNTISGFEVKNGNINGTYLGGYGVRVNGHHNTISKMNVHHVWQNGIIATGDYTTVEDSTIWQAARANMAGTASSGWAAGLSAARNGTSAAIVPGITSYATLRRNISFNNYGEGISCFEADHCTMEDNISYDNWSANMYLSDATNSLVQRNMAYISSAPAISTRDGLPPAGITLADEVSRVPRSANNAIINNFIYNTDLLAFRWTIVTGSGLNNTLIANNTIVDGNLFTGAGGSRAITNTNSQIRNNIIFGTARTASAVPSNSGITFSNNNWSKTPTLAASGTDIVGDPHIARAGTTTPGTLTPDYFKILGSSPVIDAATPMSAVNNDFFQVVRGSRPDIGGDEFNPTTPTSGDSVPPTAPSSLSATASSSTQVNLAWIASTDNVGVSGYRIYRDGTEIGTSTVASFTDTSVAGGKTYNYTVKASDAAGNLSAASNMTTVNTPPASAALNITSHYVGNITATSGNIKWTTNVPSNGVISYSVISAYNAEHDLGLHATVSNMATSQSVSLTGLYKYSRYYYKITVNSGSATASTAVFTFDLPGYYN